MEAERKGLSVTEVAISCIPWLLLVWNVISWEEKDSEYWGISLIALFVIGTLSMEYFKWASIPDLKEDVTNCDWYGISPNGKLLSLGLRLLAMAFAVIQVLIFLDTRNGFSNIVSKIKLLEVHPYLNVTVPNNFYLFTEYAAVASLFYIVSGIILLITLCQCGAKLKNNNLNNVHKTEILRWGLHDIILGSIWLALSVQFHDLIDDLDDSNWRHLFSSMVVFHVIILLFDIMANPKYRIDWHSPQLALWSDATKPALKEILRFIFYSLIYYCLLNRLHEDKLLVTMGIATGSTNIIIIASIFLVIINLSELNTQRKVFINGTKTTNVISNGSKKAHSNYNEVRTLNF